MDNEIFEDDIKKYFELKSIDYINRSRYGTLWKGDGKSGWINKIENNYYGSFAPIYDMSDHDLMITNKISLKDFMEQKFPQYI